MRNPCQLYKGDLKKKKKKQTWMEQLRAPTPNKHRRWWLIYMQPTRTDTQKNKKQKNFIVPEVTTSS